MNVAGGNSRQHGKLPEQREVLAVLSSRRELVFVPCSPVITNNCLLLNHEKICIPNPDRVECA